MPLAARADPIPVETLFKKSQYGRAVLSPSGRYLAILIPIKDRQGIAIMDLNANVAKAMPAAEGDVVDVLWQNDERLLAYIGDRQRLTGEVPIPRAIWAMDRDGSNARRVGGAVVHLVPDSDDLFIEGYERSHVSLDLYRYNTRSGHREMLSFESPGNVSRWLVDFDGVARAAVTTDVGQDTSAWYVRKNAESPWQKVDEGVVNNIAL
jgi:hypothetical protein